MAVGGLSVFGEQAVVAEDWETVGKMWKDLSGVAQQREVISSQLLV